MPRALGESVAHYDAYVRAWRALHLATLPGYPAWEREVFDVLHAHFSTLGVLFLQYADVLGSAVGRPPGQGWG